MCQIKCLAIGLALGLCVRAAHCQSERPNDVDRQESAVQKPSSAVVTTSRPFDPIESFRAAKGYWHGEDGYPHDETKAFELFKMSASADYPPALYYLSKIYIKGSFTVPVNEPAGIELLRRAARLGLRDAEIQLRERDRERNR